MDSDASTSLIDDLATLSGALEGGAKADARMTRALLGIVQAKPQPEHHRILHEFAAKHLPALVEKYRESDGAMNPAAVMLNNVTFTPYFVRFSGTPAGAGLVVLQAERILADKDNFNPGNKPIDEIAELGQLFSTLLVLQGVQDIKEEDRKKLFALMLQWVKTMPPVFAVEVVERCLMILEDDAEARQMVRMVKTNLEKPLQECGAPGCSRRKAQPKPQGKKTKADKTMLQCSRCKTAVYCGETHQKQAWSTHRPLCFEISV